AAFLSERLPLARRARSTRRCSQPPYLPCQTRRSPSGWMPGVRARPRAWPSGLKIEHAELSSFRPSPRKRGPSAKVFRARDRRSGFPLARECAEVGLLKPGATIGILGGGQLARMLALAAAPLGLRCHVYSPGKDSCAFDVVHTQTCANYEDEVALGRFAGAVDVITYEFENVPARTAGFLARRKPVLPDPEVLETTQDRLIEKNFISALKIATAPFAPVHSATQLSEAVKTVGLPAVLKTRQLGYDGKGQAKIVKGGDPAAAWRSVFNAPSILEGFIDFE